MTSSQNNRAPARLWNGPGRKGLRTDMWTFVRNLLVSVCIQGRVAYPRSCQIGTSGCVHTASASQ